MNSHNENTKSILEVEKAHSHDLAFHRVLRKFYARLVSSRTMRLGRHSLKITVIWLKMTVISRAPH